MRIPIEALSINPQKTVLLFLLIFRPFAPDAASLTDANR